MRKLNKQSFILKANIVHNNCYDYSEFEYINNKTKGIIICLVHGKFTQTPNNHLNGVKCSQCRTEIKKISTEQFIERAEFVHPNKYDYTKSKYINNNTKIIIICKKHGEFKQTPKNHLNKDGCLKCRKTNCIDKGITKTIVKFIKEANKIHNDKYDYSLFKYVNNKTKSTIICLAHGSFQQSPNDHLRGNGCQKCYFEKLKIDKVKSQIVFIEEANLIHNNKYNYSELKYINDSSNVIIICSIHGHFKQKANNHLNGSGCPSCAHVISKSEISWLNFLNVPEIFRHKTIQIANKKYKLDALDDENKIIWEFYGDYWHGNPNKYSSDKIHPSRKISFGSLYNETLQRENVLKNAGYTIISIWEEEWNKINT